MSAGIRSRPDLPGSCVRAIALKCSLEIGVTGHAQIIIYRHVADGERAIRCGKGAAAWQGGRAVESEIRCLCSAGDVGGGDVGQAGAVANKIG